MDMRSARFAEHLLPGPDVVSRHQVEVEAPTDVVYAATRELDLSRSWVIRTLFRLRGMPRSALNANGLNGMRFKPVAEAPNEGFALAIIGQFWKPSGKLVDFEPSRFANFDEAGYTKALWTFEVSAITEHQSLLRTATLVKATDADSRRKFKRYWTLVGPFSGLIRTRMLALVREAAEST